jgi:glucose/arabinose dehydrogenase
MNRAIFILTLFANLAVHGAGINDYYKVENIPAPKGLDVQIGGLAFLPDGRLAACFHRGEVYTYNPKTKIWKLFADGLHEPLGIIAEDNHTLVVMQRPELTRLRDTDGDGEADHYQTISDDFGMTGNYHEFAFGPARDKDGNYYVGLNLASSGASIRPEIRGEFRHYGISREQFYKNHRAGSGRMYSATPYRGWIMKIAPDGKTTPFASGFRSPNGVNFDAQGRLWATDNQGDWLGTSKLFHVKENNFHGHPASLAWTDSWEKGRNPLKVPPSEFDAKRTRASVLFPQGSMANSPTQMLTDTSGGKFGPFAGQLLVGEMNKPRIMRVLVDEVAGETQGACLPFIDNGGLHRGMHRFVFAPDGNLWAGQTHLSWVGASGLQRITWTGKTPMSVSSMKLTQTGFHLTFTKPLAKVTAENFTFQRYYYKYHQSYGSPQLGKEPIKVTAVKLSKDNQSVAIDLEKLNPGYVYQLDLKNVTASDKTPALNTYICYTLNRLTNGDNKAPHLTAGNTRKTKPVKAAAKVVQAKPMDFNQTEQIFEAEEGGRTGPSLAKNSGGYTGKGFVDFRANSGEHLNWLIRSKNAGECSLSFRYALAGGNRPLQLKVNGKVIIKALPFVSTGSWTNWKTLTTTASLKAGVNDIRLESTGSSGPNIDNLTIERN